MNVYAQGTANKLVTFSQNVSEAGKDKWEELAIGLTVKQAVDIEVVCENTSATPVFFDNLEVKVQAIPTVLVVQENHYYPFGLGMKGLDWTLPTNAKEDKYSYNGKEKQTDFDLGWSDYGARQYDPQCGRWTSVDPKAEKYNPISPYVYVANNPLKYIDPNGMEIDPASKDEVNRLKGNITTKINDLTTERNNITTAATNKKGKIKYTEEQKAQVAELNYRIGELNTAHTDIVSLENDTKFMFKLQVVDGNIAEIAPTAQDVNTNTFTLNYVRGDIGNEIHEVAKHGSQIVNGDLAYSVGVDGNVNATVRNGITHHDLEVSAYLAQYSYTGTLNGQRVPIANSVQSQLNMIGGTTGTEKQLNMPFSITNHSQINVDLIRNMTVNSIGATKMY